MTDNYHHSDDRDIDEMRRKEIEDLRKSVERAMKLEKLVHTEEFKELILDDFISGRMKDEVLNWTPGQDDSVLISIAVFKRWIDGVIEQGRSAAEMLKAYKEGSDA